MIVFIIYLKQKATPVSLEGRPQLKLLPRSVPGTQSTELESSSKASSIFGTGKARDINKPEIKQLEERLEQTLILSKKQSDELAAAAQTGGATKLNSSSNSDTGSSNQNERMRTTSTTSSNNSNRK